MIKINKKTYKIVVLSGGFQPEHYVSTLMGKNVAIALKRAGYKNVYQVNVDKHIIKKLQKLKPDFAFPAMVCKWGEDGVIQSLLEVMEIPYSGNGVEACALCNNKFYFTLFTKSLGLNVPETVFFDDQREALSAGRNQNYPCVVKSLYQGNSIGVSFVKNYRMYQQAIKLAFQFSTKIIIQQYIPGRELTIGVIDAPEKDPFVLPPLEFQLGTDKFIKDVEEKEERDLRKMLAPAPLTSTQLRRLETQTLKLYRALGCLGVSRFDVRMDDKERFYFLENNVFPGIPSVQMSNITTEMRLAGISMEQFVEYMILSGLKRKPTKLEYICD